MQVLSEALIKLQELSDAERRQQKGNRQASRIDREQQYAARNRIARRCQRQHRRQDWPDARRPTKRKREPQQESAPNSRLSRRTPQMHVAIQPARQRRPEKSNNRKREKVYCSQSRKQRPVVD